MQTINRIDPLRIAVDVLRQDGPIALVPTMGALHDGHLTLVRAAKAIARHVAVSIFVNPRQFGANEDLAAYPRQLARDAALLAAEGVSLLWAPDVSVMYPDDYATNVSVSGISERLCGEARPGHFDGVATVVCKLFNQVRPDLALFGEKDWQQLAVIRRMALDLDLSRPHSAKIIGVPTVREADGLAMSSRNAYLTAPERTAAAALPQAMRATIERVRAGDPFPAALEALEAVVLGAGFLGIDYARIADAETLATLGELGERPARLLVAARIGKARLIDNMAV
ncbi:MAG: pantoate--beta-alanine ligase [Novosphingobium sp.]|nr:pantoate--beta-alanine ligase [Novosphingobium sp.]